MQVCTSLQTDNHTSTPPLSFYRLDALPAAQPWQSTEGEQCNICKQSAENLSCSPNNEKQHKTSLITENYLCNLTDILSNSFSLPSVLWRCWLGSRKNIRPAKNWAVGCWRGYLSGARCRLAYGPADATATHCHLLQQKSRLVLRFWCRLTRVVLDIGPLNGCVCVCVLTSQPLSCSNVWSTRIYLRVDILTTTCTKDHDRHTDHVSSNTTKVDLAHTTHSSNDYFTLQTHTTHALYFHRPNDRKPWLYFPAC